MRILVTIVALLGAACAPAPSGQAGHARRPNILLVTVDTVRADHTSAHGYGKNTTPYLAELAAGGVRFERAYATSSWTVPSIASLLTALEPSAHGIVYGFVENGEIVDQQILADAHRSLAEELRDAGYRTAAVTTNGHLTARFGFAQGFDRYANHGFVDASVVRDEIESLSGFVREPGPWFLWVHLFDPHAPYEWTEWTDGFLSDVRSPDRALMEELAQITDRGTLSDRGIRADDREHQHLTALYDGEIRSVDDHLRALVEQLALGEDDLIVVTSDHGEEFFDHGDCWHGHSLYEETIRVPLVLRLPAGAHAGAVVGHPVSLIDVMPTILEIAGVAVPETVQGRSLFEAPRSVRASVAKLDPYETLIDARFKYILDIANGEHALYDLAVDPGETTNLTESHAEVVAEMRRKLARWILDQPEYTAESAPLVDEHVAALRSLGYVN